MYISESSLYGFIVIVVMIILLVWAIRKAYKSDVKHNKSKFEPPKYASRDKKYRELRDLLVEAYVQFRDNGFDIEWDFEYDGFTILYDHKKKEVGSVYVFYDKTGEIAPKKEFTLIGSYSFLLEDDYDIKMHKKVAEAINHYNKNFLQKDYITHTVKPGTNAHIYTATYAIIDIKSRMKKFAAHKTFYILGEYLNSIKKEFDRDKRRCLLHKLPQ